MHDVPFSACVHRNNVLLLPLPWTACPSRCFHIPLLTRTVPKSLNPAQSFCLLSPADRVLYKLDPIPHSLKVRLAARDTRHDHAPPASLPRPLARRRRRGAGRIAAPQPGAPAQAGGPDAHPDAGGAGLGRHRRRAATAAPAHCPTTSGRSSTCAGITS